MTPRSIPRCTTIAAGLPLAIVLAVGAPPAPAAPAAVLTDRSATTWTHWFCGAGTEAKEGGTGSTVPVLGLHPITLESNDAGDYQGAFYDWHCQFDDALRQAWSTDSAAGSLDAIHGEGSMALNLAGHGTIWVSAIDQQTLSFSVSDATPWHLVGGAHGGQSVALQAWSPSQHQWLPVMNPFYETDFDVAGVLPPGRYRTATSPYAFTADGSPWSVDATWGFTLSFDGVSRGPLACGDFAGQAAGQALGSRYRAGPITLKRTDGTSATVASVVDPSGEVVLGATFGGGVTRASAKASGSQVMLWLLPSGADVLARALDANGNELSRASLVADGYLQFAVLATSGKPIASVELSGGDGASVLQRLCGVR